MKLHLKNTMAYKVLLVEDEEHIQQALKLNLEIEGYIVLVASDGVQAIKDFKQQSFDLVILDIMLPEMDGLMVCEQIRLENADVPVLFLSAKSTTADRIQGLRKGADDYLTKPFDLEELLLRVKRLVEKGQKINHPKDNNGLTEFTFGNNRINFESYEAKGIKGKNILLTKTETMLLKVLIENKNQVISREHLYKAVWDYNVIPNTRTIDNFILTLRRHFEIDPKHPRYIRSVRGVGYKFVI